MLCHQFDISEEVLIEAIRAGYPRLSFLSVPGPGVGGFCIPKDALVLHDGLKGMDAASPVLKNFYGYPYQQYQLNADIIQFHQEKIRELTKSAKCTLALGIAFKGQPQTDDVRSSVGLGVVQFLMSQGQSVEAYDRTVSPSKTRALGIPVAAFPLNLSRYDAVLILNNDPEYRHILTSRLSSTENTTALYDPWRLLVRKNDSIFQQEFRCGSLKEAHS